jgi:hypothetical protein
MMDNFASVLRDKLRKDMNAFTDDMANGICTDYATYQKLCGIIQGLALAERHLLDLVDAQKKDEDEDERPALTTGNNNARTNSANRQTKRSSPY